MRQIAILTGTRIGSKPHSRGSRARAGVLAAALLLLQAPDSRAQGFLRDYVVLQESFETQEVFASRAVPCPAGLQVLGGGVRNVTQGLGIFTSAPVNDFWRGRARRFGNTPALIEIEVTVVCGRVENYSRVEQQSAVDATSPKSLTVNCPPGTSVLGGGVDANGGLFLPLGVASSAPSGNGWFGLVNEYDAIDDDWSITVHAICGVVPNRFIFEDLSALDSANSKTVSASCEEFLVPTSAGAQVFFDTREVLSDLSPIDNNEWTSSAFEPIVHLENWRLRTSVICAPEPDAAALALGAIATVMLLAQRRRGFRSIR